ncbi:MAG: barstar family protein, partial [Actinomycetia bacterium]|nr:barstar family protein [Actinomycetes bacterium]
SGVGAGSWDVLDQHLRALDLDEPNGLLVCWESWGAFAEADPDSFEMAIEIFQDACIAWEYDKFQAAVLLVGDGPETDVATW